MRSRRELFTWFLDVPAAPVAPDAPVAIAAPMASAAPGDPAIPPEIAARAARFRAEREARASATLPPGRISWLDDAESAASDVRPRTP